MPAPKRETERIDVAHVAAELPGLIDAVATDRTRVLIERGGRPVAALVSAEDVRRLAQWEQKREELFKVIDDIREAFKDVPAEEIEAETDRIIARNRAADRAAREALAASR